jgi:hypothetical protein
LIIRIVIHVRVVTTTVEFVPAAATVHCVVPFAAAKMIVPIAGDDDVIARTAFKDVRSSLSLWDESRGGPV